MEATTDHTFFAVNVVGCSCIVINVPPYALELASDAVEVERVLMSHRARHGRVTPRQHRRGVTHRKL